MAQNRVVALIRTTLAGSALTSSYQAINASGLDGACFQITITNTTNGAIDISYDGTNTHDIVVGSSSITIMAQANAQPTGWTALFQKGLVVYVKGSMGSGNIYLTGYYVSN